MSRYEIKFGHPGNQVSIGYADSLEAAKALRKVNGDIVYLDGEVCQDHFWLWDWEKTEENSYALEVIRSGKLPF